LTLQKSAWVRLHAAVLLFGLSGLFGKAVHLPPTALVFGRTAFAAATLLGVLLLNRRVEAGRPRPPGGSLLLSGAVLAFYWAAFFQAIQVSSVAIALLTFSSFPLFVTLLEPLCFREPLRRGDLGTACGVACGLALIVPRFDLGLQSTQGALWGLLSGLSFAVLAIINRRLAGGHSPVAVAAGQNFCAACVLLPLAVASGARPGVTDWWLLAGLGVFCTALAHVLFIGSLSQLRAQVVSVVTALEAVYGILFAILLLGEQPALRTLAGGVLVLGTVVWAGRREAASAAKRPNE
jgi:drug/metabolite transporter (DMT)-like permease